MKKSVLISKFAIILWLLASSVSGQAVLADDAPAYDMLQSETAVADSSQSTQAVASQNQPAKSNTMLEAEIHKRDKLPLSQHTSTGLGNSHNSADLKADDNDEMLQAETAANDEQKFQLAVAKLASGASMTGDDYRDLQIGTCGYFSTQHNTDKYAKITAVCAGSPAQEAGIKKGDIVLYNESLPNADPRTITHPMMTLNFEHPGSVTHLTLKRGNDVMNYTLTRINIEDLPKEQDREIYEKGSKFLGSSREGTVVINGDYTRNSKNGKPSF